MTPDTSHPTLLVIGDREHSLADVVRSLLDLQSGEPCHIASVPSGSLARRWLEHSRADVIIINTDSTDDAMETARTLRADPRLQYAVPILLFTHGKPTPAMRVAALRAGAWGLLDVSNGTEEVSLTLQSYLRAKRSIDDDGTEFGAIRGGEEIGRAVLARRAREVGTLLARKNCGLACAVFAFGPGSFDVNAAVAHAQRALRLCDVARSWGQREFAVVAPGTDGPGAVALVHRVVDHLRHATLREGLTEGARWPGVRVGYDAVDMLVPGASDPAELLAHAATAVQRGRPDRDYPWVRAFSAPELNTVTPT